MRLCSALTSRNRVRRACCEFFHMYTHVNASETFTFYLRPKVAAARPASVNGGRTLSALSKTEERICCRSLSTAGRVLARRSGGRLRLPSNRWPDKHTKKHTHKVLLLDRKSSFGPDSNQSGARQSERVKGTRPRPKKRKRL